MIFFHDVYIFIYNLVWILMNRNLYRVYVWIEFWCWPIRRYERNHGERNKKRLGKPLLRISDNSMSLLLTRGLWSESPISSGQNSIYIVKRSTLRLPITYMYTQIIYYFYHLNLHHRFNDFEKKAKSCCNTVKFSETF